MTNSPIIIDTTADLPPVALFLGQKTAIVKENETDGAILPLHAGESWGDSTEIPPGVLARQITIATGTGRECRQWINRPDTVSNLIAILSDHKAGKKDGLSMLQGECIDGLRQAKSIKQLDIVSIDCDCGDDMDLISHRIEQLGLFAVIYTTHGHLRPSTSIDKSDSIKFIKTDERAITAEDCTNYLRDIKEYREPIPQGVER